MFFYALMAGLRERAMGLADFAWHAMGYDDEFTGFDL